MATPIGPFICDKIQIF